MFQVERPTKLCEIYKSEYKLCVLSRAIMALGIVRSMRQYTDETVPSWWENTHLKLVGCLFSFTILLSYKVSICYIFLRLHVMALLCVQLKNWLTTSRERSISFVHNLTCRAVSSVNLTMLVRSLSLMAKSWINKVKKVGSSNTTQGGSFVYTIRFLAELRRAKRASGAPWVRNIGKPSIQ